MEVKGKLLEVFDEVQVNDRFKKREFVIEYADNPQYPEYIKLECIQDKCNMLDSFSIGQEINVSINLKGRKWTDPRGETKYFNTLQAWRIEPAEGASGGQPAGQSAAGQPAQQPARQTQPANASNTGDMLSAGEEGDDDLPF